MSCPSKLRMPMSQSFTLIDVAGNQAQYTVSEKDHHNDFRWSTDHGDHGVAPSSELAQYQARRALKDSMAANRRSDEAPRTDNIIPCAGEHTELGNVDLATSSALRTIVRIRQSGCPGSA